MRFDPDTLPLWFWDDLGIYTHYHRVLKETPRMGIG